MGSAIGSDLAATAAVLALLEVLLLLWLRSRPSDRRASLGDGAYRLGLRRR